MSEFRRRYANRNVDTIMIDTESTFWAIVCKTVRPMLSDRRPVCPVLSVTLVHCGQTVARIKMKLGMQAGLGLA